MSNEEKEILYHIEQFIVKKKDKWTYVRPLLPHPDMGKDFVAKYEQFFDKVSKYLRDRDYKIYIKGWNNDEQIDVS